MLQAHTQEPETRSSFLLVCVQCARCFWSVAPAESLIIGRQPWGDGADQGLWLQSPWQLLPGEWAVLALGPRFNSGLEIMIEENKHQFASWHLLNAVGGRGVYLGEGKKKKKSTKTSSQEALQSLFAAFLGKQSKTQ